MTVTVLYNDGAKNSVHTNVWEIQDNEKEDFILKYHDHRVERIKKSKVYGLEVDPDGAQQLYIGG